MFNILFGNADTVGQYLGNDGHMAGHFKLAAFAPDQHAARFRMPQRAIHKRMQRQPFIGGDNAHRLQAENIVSHGNVIENIAVVEQ